MKFHIMTLFPDMINDCLRTSIIGKAIKNNTIILDTVNIRDYTSDKHNKVDDYPYGGGAGMLIQAQPVFDTHKAILDKEKKEKIRTVYMTPQGTTFTQKMAEDFSKEENLIILCGHYEGIDERVLEEVVTDYVSIGDYILTGGELAAMVMVDAISRLVPDVLNNNESAETESFYNDLLEYPQYTRPEVWQGKSVPKVLLSGDHKKIKSWRVEESEKRTKERRFDLFLKYLERQKLIKKLEKNKKENIHMIEALRSGNASILKLENHSFLLQDQRRNLCYIEAETKNEFNVLVELLPKECDLLVTTKEEVTVWLKEHQWNSALKCYQTCYTQREPLKIKHKDIRPLSIEHLEFVLENYKKNSEIYTKERLLGGNLYGAFVEEKLVGMIGSHSEGGIGLLFVKEEYRRAEIGSSLEAFMINKYLTEGKVPFGHIVEGNIPSESMQKKIGLYFSKKPMWWIEKQI